MKFCLQKTCARLVAAVEEEGCHCPCPGGRRGGPSSCEKSGDLFSTAAALCGRKELAWGQLGPLCSSLG